MPHQFFPEVSNKIFEFLIEISELGVATQQDCLVPTCFFKDKQLAYLIKQNNIGLHLGSCNPVIDISPDLEVHRCLSLSNYKKKKLEDFKDAWDIYYYLKKIIDNELIKIPLFDKCCKCRYHLKYICQGGCLAYKLTLLEKKNHNKAKI